jgi:predicted nuclease with RNAse H fold
MITVNEKKEYENMRLLGIDLGGRTTGKTAVSFLDTNQKEVILYSREYIAEKCGKSDKEFISFIESFNADVIGIDAPLSLPDFKSENYLYRNCDKKLKALSPMTLGEITARAIYIKENLSCPNVFEVYPKTLMELHKINHKGYKRDQNLQNFIWKYLNDNYELKFPEIEMNEDNLDCIMAVLILYHFDKKKYMVVNDKPPFVIPTL